MQPVPKLTIKDIPLIADLTTDELEDKIVERLRLILSEKPSISAGLSAKLSSEIGAMIVDDLIGRDRGPGAVLNI